MTLPRPNASETSLRMVRLGVVAEDDVVDLDQEVVGGRDGRCRGRVRLGHAAAFVLRTPVFALEAARRLMRLSEAARSNP